MSLYFVFFSFLLLVLPSHLFHVMLACLPTHPSCASQTSALAPPPSPPSTPSSKRLRATAESESDGRVRSWPSIPRGERRTIAIARAGSRDGRGQNNSMYLQADAAQGSGNGEGNDTPADTNGSIRTGDKILRDLVKRCRLTKINT